MTGDTFSDYFSDIYLGLIMTTSSGDVPCCRFDVFVLTACCFDQSIVFIALSGTAALPDPYWYLVAWPQTKAKYLVAKALLSIV